MTGDLYCCDTSMYILCNVIMLHADLTHTTFQFVLGNAGQIAEIIMATITGNIYSFILARIGPVLNLSQSGDEALLAKM